jgi:hypothetical protein
MFLRKYFEPDVGTSRIQDVCVVCLPGNGRGLFDDSIAFLMVGADQTIAKRVVVEIFQLSLEIAFLLMEETFSISDEEFQVSDLRRIRGGEVYFVENAVG